MIKSAANISILNNNWFKVEVYLHMVVDKIIILLLTTLKQHFLIFKLFMILY